MEKRNGDRVESNMKILIYNRQKKTVEEELIYANRLSHLFYGTYLGRQFTGLFLTWRPMSRLWGIWQNSPRSTRKIDSFINKHGINMGEIAIPDSGFRNFNDFFTRKLKPGARPVQTGSEILISPADSRLLVYPIEREMIYPVKGVHFSIEELVADRTMPKPYYGGTCLVFRLAPTDYHRFCYIDDGSHGPVNSIGRSLHSVSPVALRQNIKVFHKNYRQYSILSTKNFGEVIQIEVGALLVGKIHQHLPHGGKFSRGQEKGYFEFGGSTIIVILKPRAVTIDEDVVRYSNRGVETLVNYGSAIGRKFLPS